VYSNKQVELYIPIIPSVSVGISVECQVDRSQIKNREIAMRTLKARIYQQELEAQISRTQTARKQQVLHIFILLCLLIV
jgi:protein subunit release factor A